MTGAMGTFIEATTVEPLFGSGGDGVLNRTEGSSEARKFAAVTLGVAGLVAMSATFAVGWWQLYIDINPWAVGGRPYHFQATSTYLPGWNYHVQCVVNDTSMPGWGWICATTGSGGFFNPISTSVVPAPSLLALYLALEGLILASVALGIASVALLVLELRRSGNAVRRPRLLGITLILAGALAIGLPDLVAIGQPIALTGDAQALGLSLPANSPDHSFWGSCGTTATGACSTANTTEYWGAGLGWYLSIVAGACFVLAEIITRPLFRPRHPPRE